MTAILRFLLIRQLNMVNVSPLPRTTTRVAPGGTTWVLACAGRSTWVPACAGTGLDERPLNQYPPAPAKAGAQYRNHLRGIKLTGPRPAQPLGLCAGRSILVPACAGRSTWVPACAGRSTWVPACAGRSTWVPACAGTGLDERPLNQYSPAPAKAGAQYRNHPHRIKLTGPRPAQPLWLCAGSSTWVPACAGRSTWVPACAGTGRVKWFAIFSCRINRSSQLRNTSIDGYLEALLL